MRSYSILGSHVREIRKGTTLLSASRRRIQLERWLEVELPAQFADRLLPINAEMQRYGARWPRGATSGIAVGIIDGFLAATAKHHELTIVTRNVRDFRRWGSQSSIPGIRPERSR